MSNRFRKQYAEPKGAIVDQPAVGILLATGTTTPTNSLSGYAPGCLYINTGGSIGSFVYFNSGTLASSTWTNIA